MKEDDNQITEINVLPVQSRRETRNSTKVAALCKQKEVSPDEITENNKRKLLYVFHYLYNI